MHLTATHLMMMMLAVVACRAAFIPNMMFAGRNRQQTQQPKAFPQQQQQQRQHQQQAVWRAAGNPLNPWDDGTETYGYLADRHPSNVMDDLTSSYQQQPQPQMQSQVQSQQQPLVYGVPHRYLQQSEPQVNNYPASPTDELYNNELYNNALLMRGRGPLNAIKRSSLSSLSSYYDAIMDDDDSANFDDGLSNMASDYYDQPISHQDVVNFEKYVQRYFQQEPSDAEFEMETNNQQQWYGDYWNVDDSEDMDNNYVDIDNDEEAARQLHLLLKQQKQQRRPITLREIQKKNSAPAVTMTTRTEAPVTTATTATTFSATLAPQSQQGQKEEPLLRPPTVQRQPQPQQMSSTTTTTTPSTLSAAKKEIGVEQTEENNNIYHTIQRLMNMRNRLQVIIDSFDRKLSLYSSSAADGVMTILCTE
jgi:hypothetical protein